MAALDLKTGETVWEVPNTLEFQMSHASILPTVLAGRKQYVCPAIGGISACDTEGGLLWQCTEWKLAVWAPTPVPIGGDRLFLTAGYCAGGAILSATSRNGRCRNADSAWGAPPVCDSVGLCDLLGALFCAGACPLGTVQEWLHWKNVPCHFPSLCFCCGRCYTMCPLNRQKESS